MKHRKYSLRLAVASFFLSVVMALLLWFALSGDEPTPADAHSGNTFRSGTHDLAFGGLLAHWSSDTLNARYGFGRGVTSDSYAYPVAWKDEAHDAARHVKGGSFVTHLEHETGSLTQAGIIFMVADWNTLAKPAIPDPVSTAARAVILVWCGNSADGGREVCVLPLEKNLGGTYWLESTGVWTDHSDHLSSNADVLIVLDPADVYEETDLGIQIKDWSDDEIDTVSRHGMAQSAGHFTYLSGSSRLLSNPPGRSSLSDDDKWAINRLYMYSSEATNACETTIDLSDQSYLRAGGRTYPAIGWTTLDDDGTLCPSTKYSSIAHYYKFQHDDVPDDREFSIGAVANSGSSVRFYDHDHASDPYSEGSAPNSLSVDIDENRLIHVASITRSGAEDFRLSIVPNDCATTNNGLLSLGSTGARMTLDTDDCLSSISSRGYADFYTFYAFSADTVTFRVSTTGSDHPYVYLREGEDAVAGTIQVQDATGDGDAVITASLDDDTYYTLEIATNSKSSTTDIDYTIFGEDPACPAPSGAAGAANDDDCPDLTPPPTALELDADDSDDNLLSLGFTESEVEDVSRHLYKFEVYRAIGENGTYTRAATEYYDSDDDSGEEVDVDGMVRGYWYKARGQRCTDDGYATCGDWSDYSDEFGLFDPAIALSGLASTITAGNSDAFQVRITDLARGQPYSVTLHSGHSSLGFDSSCTSTDDASYTASTTTSRTFNFDAHACRTPGGTITARLREGSTTGTVVDTAAASVTIGSSVVAPAAVGTISDRSVNVNSSFSVGVGLNFSGTTPLTYSATSSNPAVAPARVNGSTVSVSGLKVGTAMITVTAKNSAGSATQTFRVTITPIAPTATGTIPGQSVVAGRTVSVNVSGYFTGTSPTYTAASSSTRTATVSVSGSTVSVRGVRAGTATVTVTATNAGGSATQTFTATVSARPVTPPGTAGTISNRTVTAGSSTSVGVSSYFTGTVDSYSASSSNTGAAMVSVSGSTVRVSGVSAGSATITVKATNSGGSATQTFRVTVRAATIARPGTTGTIGGQAVVAGNTITVNASSYFTGTVTSYSASSSASSVATASASGAVVTVRGVAVGTATITITASNAGGSATQTFGVTVRVAAPQASGTIADRTIDAYASTSLDVSDYFTGTVLRYRAGSSNGSVAKTTMSGSALTVQGNGAGTAVVTVVASNDTGGATQTFNVTVVPAVAIRDLGTSSGARTSDPFSVSTAGLTANRQYTVALETDDDSIGFTDECEREQSYSFYATAASHSVDTRLYLCDTPGGTVTVKLLRGDIDGTELDEATFDVTVTAPVLTAPAVPSNVSASGTSRSSIRVSWSSGTGVDLYRVQYRNADRGSWITAGTTTGTSYTKSSLSCGTTYQFRAAAYGDDDIHTGWSRYSSRVSARTSSCLNPAPAPGGVTISGIQKYQVNVSWNSVPGTTRYLVTHQAQGTNRWVYAGTTTSRSFTVTGLNCETTYRIRLQAYGDGSSYRYGWGYSGYSNRRTTSDCPPIAPAPEGFTGYSYERGEIDVSWYPRTGIARWRIEYQLESAASWVTASDSITGTDYEVTGLECDVTYKVRVSSYGDGEIWRYAWSPTAEVTVRMDDCEKPYFTYVPIHGIWVSPGTRIGTTVFEAHALDSTSDDVLTYRIVSGNTGNTFEMDSTNGDITTRRALGHGPYRLNVVVKDKLNQVNTMTVPIYVRHTYLASFDVGEVTLREAGPRATIELRLNKRPTEPVSVSVGSAYDQNLADEDFAGVPIILDFAIGERSKSFEIWAPDDDEVEGLEGGAAWIATGGWRGDIKVARESDGIVEVFIEDNDVYRIPVWDTTLTVGDYGNSQLLYGFSDAMTGDPAGSIGSNSFDLLGTTYTISGILYSNHGETVAILFAGNRPPDGDLDGLVFYIGDTELRYTDISKKPSSAISWLVSGIDNWDDWEVGDEVEIRLIQEQSHYDRHGPSFWERMDDE